MQTNPSRTEFDALIACDASNCASECQAYLASIDQCLMTQNGSMTITGATDDCMNCQAGIGQWTGTGCNGPLVTCSYDQTCCTSCANWIGSGGDIDNICNQPPPVTVTSVDYSINLSSCVCSAGCPTACASICVDNGAGFKYIDNGAGLSFGCMACMFGACGQQYMGCSGH
jgi:hypothetical protein